MSEVRRWEHRVVWEGLQISATYMAINDGGEYVMHDDYAALETERDELRQQLAERDAIIERLEAGIPRLQEQAYQLRQQRDKLAVLLRDISSSESRGLDWAKKIVAALAEINP